MAVPIAELFISVSADVNSAISGLNALSNKLNSTTAAFDQAKPAALALTAAAAGIGAGFAAAVNVAADFEHQMSGVKAVMSTDEIAQFGTALSELALKLGRDTVFTSREAAAGIEELIKAGVPAEAVLGGAAKAATDLAAATGIPVADAATVAAQAINTFGANASNLTPVVDRLAAVANASASDVSFLRFGLAAAGGVAAGFGVSLDDTLVTLGLLSNRFATGADAGTSFKTFLNGLTPDTKKQNAEFRKLGLITEDGSNRFFDAAHNVKSMAEVAGVLRTALGGLGAEQRQTTLQTLFGTDAQRAANALYELGGEKVQTFKDQTGASGVAAASAATRLDNLQGALGQLGGSFETVQIIVGNFFLPVIRKIAEAVKGPLDAFSTMSPAAQGLVTAIIGVTGAAAGVVGGLTLLVPIVRTLGPSFVAVGRVLLSLVPAFRIVALVAGTLAAAWATNLFGIREKVQTAFDAIPGILDRVSKAFSDAGDFWNTTISPVLQKIADTVGQKFGEIAATVQASPLGQAIGKVFDVVGTIFNQIINGDGQQVIDFFGQLLPKPFRDLAAAIGEPVGRAFEFISKIFDQVVSGHGDEVIKFFGDLLPQPFKDLAGAIAGPVGQAFGFISNIFDQVINGNGQQVIDFFGQLLPEPFRTLATAIGDKVGPVFESIGQIFLDIVSGNGDLVLTFFKKSLPESFVAFGASAGENVGKTFSDIGTIFKAIVSGDGQKITEFFREHLPQSLADFIIEAAQSPEVLFKIAGALVTIQSAIDNLKPANIVAVGESLGGSFLANLSSIGTSLAPLLPVFQSVGGFLASVGNVFAAFAELRARQTAAGQGATGEDPLVSSLQRLADFLSKNANLGDLFFASLGPFGTALQQIAANSASTVAFFDNLSTALNNFATAVRGLPELPPWLQSMIAGDNLGAMTAAAQAGRDARAAAPQIDLGAISSDHPLFGTGGQFQKQKTAFNPAEGAGGGGSGPLVQIGQLIISNEAEAEAFLARMAEAVRGSAGRVNAPPDNSGNPQLQLVFA